MTSFEEFAKICKQIENVSSSLEMTSIVSEFLKNLNDDELEIATLFIMGEIFPLWSNEETGIGPSLLYSAISKTSSVSIQKIKEFIKETGDVGLAAEKAISHGKFMAFFSKEELSIKDIFLKFKTIAQLSGKGSQDAKIKVLQYLFGNAKPTEIVYLTRLAIEKLRIGVGEGIVRNAIAKAFDVESELVERGIMLTNDIGLVAKISKNEGKSGLLKLDVIPERPLKMMLAQISSGIEEAINEMGIIAVEWKYDGARVQIHKYNNKITIYSRKLEDITLSLPDIVKLISNINAESYIFDGEAVAYGKDKRSMPFQDVLKRFRRKYNVSSKALEIPLHLYLFDIIYLNGVSLIDKPLKERRKALESICDESILAKQVVTDSIDIIYSEFTKALSEGHEGVMLKALNSFYTPGKRGKNWLKLKQIMATLDLVVVGGEWGEGRRTNFFGSYVLACHEPETGKLLTIGKVATGITDDKLDELTKLFKELVISENGVSVEFEPKIVFEVAFEEIQKSQNYNSGYALRFPRFVNLRIDKSYHDADSIEDVEKLFVGQKKSEK